MKSSFSGLVSGAGYPISGIRGYPAPDTRTPKSSFSGLVSGAGYLISGIRRVSGAGYPYTKMVIFRDGIRCRIPVIQVVMGIRCRIQRIDLMLIFQGYPVGFPGYGYHQIFCCEMSLIRIVKLHK